MTDIGHTGIQVAPEVPTEDEMNKVQDILTRAITAVVNMSQLKADVDMLRQTVQSLQADTERLRRQNAGLDEALFQSRTARNDLTTKLSAAEGNLAQADSDFTVMVKDRDYFRNQVQGLEDKLHNAEHERDDAQLRVMELEDQVKSLTDKLDKVKALFGDEPKAVQSEIEHGKSIDPANVPVQAQPAPMEALTDPTPPTPTRRYLTGWQAGALWDSSKQQYYLEEEPMPF